MEKSCNRRSTEIQINEYVFLSILINLLKAKEDGGDFFAPRLESE